MSILSDLKDRLGIYDESFDFELLNHLNNANMILTQNGITKPDEITANTLIENIVVQGVPNYYVFRYLYLNVKLAFDAPAQSTLEYMRMILQEDLWRLNSYVDFPNPLEENA